MKDISLQSRIARAMWIMTAVGTIAAAILTGILLIHNHRESIRSQLEAAAISLTSLGISDFSELEDFDQLNLFIEGTLEMEKVDKLIRIYDSSGQLIFTTAGLEHDQLPNRLINRREKPVFLTVEGRQRRYESLIIPYFGKGRKKPYYLQVAIPLPPYQHILGSLWWQNLLLLGLLIGISLGLSRWLARRLLKPVVEIANYLQQMDPAHVEKWRPLPVGERGLYLDAIIRGIDSLAERTRSAVLQLRKIGRYVAHEMRTPLTILQGEAETVLSKMETTQEDYRRVLQSSLEEIQRMSEIITTVLGIGDREGAASAVRPVSFSLNDWVGENKPRWEKILGRVIQTTKSDSNSSVFTDPTLLSHVVDNLVRNVRVHTPKESGCSISVINNAQGIFLQIQDEGPGLESSFLEALNRGETLCEGMGVGLHLCRKITDLCGWELAFSHKTGKGLLVEIRFSE